jgi:hypothetical protein
MSHLCHGETMTPHRGAFPLWPGVCVLHFQEADREPERAVGVMGLMVIQCDLT